jgi:thiamine biosynthesis lipoprotein
MGMPITVDILNCKEDAVFEAVFDRLAEIDRRYSTYKKNSEVTLFREGKLKQAELSDELKKVIKECEKARKMTDGYFSAWAAGAFDPSGYVKGWAIAEAGKIVAKNGYKDFCISAGGDILASSGGSKKWEVGIQDPRDKNKILNKLSISNGAVATSGNYERGEHIINPKTKKPASELMSVTVVGPNIIKADILATACIAMGEKADHFMTSQPDYQAILVTQIQP